MCMTQRRRVAIVLALPVAIVLVVGGSMILREHDAKYPDAYTVAEVVAGLQQHPNAWIGRTILVRAVVLVQADAGCLIGPNSFARELSHPRRCLNRQIHWLYLGETDVRGALSVLVRPPISMSSFRVVPAQQVRDVGTPALASAPFMPALSIGMRPGANLNQLPLRQEHRELPDEAYNLPVVGPMLARLFPQTNVPAVIVRIHLNMAQGWLCVGHETSASCSDGVLMSS